MKKNFDTIEKTTNIENFDIFITRCFEWV
jgi:hypothetical protein